MGEVKLALLGGVFQPTLGTDKSFDGEWSPLTAGESLSFGHICYLKSDGKLWKADADAAATMPALFMCVAKGGLLANATGPFLIRGWVRNDAWNWTVGGKLYADEGTGGTAGGMIQSIAGFTTGDQVQCLGIGGTTADYAFFDPDKTLVEVA